jgi:hypothetical protein
MGFPARTSLFQPLSTRSHAYNMIFTTFITAIVLFGVGNATPLDPRTSNCVTSHKGQFWVNTNSPAGVNKDLQFIWPAAGRALTAEIQVCL